MNNLTTTHLKCLLKKATPGPWETKDPDCITSQSGEVLWNADQAVDWSRNDHDVNLAAAAPELARELLILRDALADVIQIWQYASTDPERTPIEQNLAARVVDHINKALGEHDE